MTEQAIDWEKTAQAVTHLISIIRHELGEDAEPTSEERENQYKRGATNRNKNEHLLFTVPLPPPRRTKPTDRGTEQKEKVAPVQLLASEERRI